jgi:acetyl esterase/lipase
MRTIRHLAVQFSIDTTRIGVLGFSAGGHLASTLMTHFDKGEPNNADPIEQKKSRPDFGILIYPVITLKGEHAHSGSCENLLGGSPSIELVNNLSNHLQVTPATPPAFLAHGDKDGSVPLENSRLFESALKSKGVHASLFVDSGKGHAYGLEGQWPDTCAKWLKNLCKILPASILSQMKFLQKGRGVRQYLQLEGNHFGMPGRNSLYYFIRFNDKKTGVIQEKLFLLNGKRILIPLHKSEDSSP